jgi:hypothetical protein
MKTINVPIKQVSGSDLIKIPFKHKKLYGFKVNNSEPDVLEEYIHLGFGTARENDEVAIPTSSAARKAISNLWSFDSQRFSVDAGDGDDEILSLTSESQIMFPRYIGNIEILLIASSILQSNPVHVIIYYE